MKKFIFTLLVFVWLWFSFSNASYVVNNTANVNAWWSYSIPSWVSSFSCDSSAWEVFLSYIVHDSYFWDMNNWQYMNCPFSFSIKWNYRNVSVQNNSSSSIKLSYLSSTDTLEFDQLLVLFTPAIDSFNSFFVEFIPYLVYIGLWIIIVTIGFVAILWLMNWIKLKINSNFRSKRG